MNARKFFKSDRSRRCSRNPPAQRNIIDDFESSNLNHKLLGDTFGNSKRKLNENHPIINQNDEESDKSDSQSSGFHSPTTSHIDDNFEFDNLENDEFEPLFRCSTPNESHNSHVNNNGNFNWMSRESKTDGEKVDLWEKAMEQNETLRKWIENFNKQIEMVDESEIIIKKINNK